MPEPIKPNQLTPAQQKELLDLAKQYGHEVSNINELLGLESATLKKISAEYLKIHGVNIKLKKIYSENEKLGRKIVDQLETRSKIEADIKENNQAIVDYVKKVQKLNKDIAAIKAEINKLETEDAKLNADTIEYLKKRVRLLSEERDLIVESVKNTSKFGVGLKLAAKGVTAIADGIKKGYGMLKGSGLFEMDKAIKNTALSMGVLKKQSVDFADQITEAAKDTIEFGVGIEDIAKIQGTYSDTMGRTVILGKQTAKAMGAVAASTGLGAEGAGKLAGDFDRIGMSAERTAEYVDQTMNDAHQMGLNASKVIRSIAENIKILNRFNFKGGAKGLAKMVEETQKMGVEMNLVAPMAEKLFDVEGAVEMSAQLQVLGGEWSKLADPFKLMYMARNDMEGLTKAVINATISTAKFNKETGEFDISSLEMQRLRKVAEATGLDFEQLAQSAKKAAQFAGIKKQISYGFDKQTEQFIESTATLDKNGRASIDINGKGVTKFVSELNNADKTLLIQRAKEKEDMAERAKGARTFDDALNNTVTLMKQLLLPIVTTLNEKLLPKLDSFIKDFKESGWVEKLENFAKTVGGIAAYVGKFILDYPKLTAGFIIGAKAISFLMEKATWFSNGLILAQGFNAGASVGGGGATGGGVMGMLANNIGKLSIATGLLAGVTSFAVNKAEGQSTGASIGRGASTGIGTGVGAFLGGALGSLVAPGAGTVIGASLGGMAGGALGTWAGNNLFDSKPKTMNDGVIQFNPQDKFTKVNDGTIVAGTNANGNKDLAAQLATRPSGVSPITQGSLPGILNINFGQLTIGGTIELKLGPNYSREFGKELIQNPAFIRDITKLIHMETEKNLNSGKPKG